MNASVENINYTIALLKWLVDRQEGDMVMSASYQRNSVTLDDSGMDGDIQAALKDVYLITDVRLIQGYQCRTIYYVEKG